MTFWFLFKRNYFYQEQQPTTTHSMARYFPNSLQSTKFTLESREMEPIEYHWVKKLREQIGAFQREWPTDSSILEPTVSKWVL